MGTVACAQTDDVRGLNGLQEVELSKLTDSNVSALGKEALSIEPAMWKHAETKKFRVSFFPRIRGDVGVGGGGVLLPRDQP